MNIRGGGGGGQLELQNPDYFYTLLSKQKLDPSIYQLGTSHK